MGLSYNYAVVDMRRGQPALLEHIIKVASAHGGYVWFTNNEVVQKEKEEDVNCVSSSEESIVGEDRAHSDRPATATASQASVDDDEEEKSDVLMDMDPASVSSYASSTDCDCEACAQTGDSELVTRLSAIADAMSRAFDRKMEEEEEEVEKKEEQKKEEGEEQEQVSCSVMSSSEQLEQPSLVSEAELNTACSAASFFEKGKTFRCNASSCEEQENENAQSLTLRRQPPHTATEPFAYIRDDGRIVSIAATSAVSKLLTSQRALLSSLDSYKTQMPTEDFAVLEAAIRSVCDDINIVIKRDYESAPTDDI